ncbi:unnamed protein product, partial [Prorocentrum cordatum]
RAAAPRPRAGGGRRRRGCTATVHCGPSAGPPRGPLGVLVATARHGGAPPLVHRLHGGGRAQ